LNSTQFFGVLVFSLGIILYIAGTIAVFFVNEDLIGLIFGFGTLAFGLGTAIILVSLVSERITDTKKDKEKISKKEGIK